MPQPTKYKAEFCEQAIRELSKMRSIASLAAKFKVHRSVIYDWIDKHPDFAFAVEHGKNTGETEHERICAENLVNRNFNPVAWQMLGRKLYGLSETRLVSIPGLDKCKTYEEQLDCVINAISNKRLTSKEAMEIASLITSKAKIYETMEAKKLLDELKAVRDKN